MEETMENNSYFPAAPAPSASKENSQLLQRPMGLKEMSRLNTSVRFQDTKSEGRPSIYLFIFVNPLSGDCKGEDLLRLPIQHFRLRRFPQVQVEIHNILDETDRKLGLERIQLVEVMAKSGQLPSLEESEKKEHTISATVRARHIHVWSCGGDGTVMSLFELLVEHHIDLDYMFFSCKAYLTFLILCSQMFFIYSIFLFLNRYSIWYRQ